MTCQTRRRLHIDYAWVIIIGAILVASAGGGTSWYAMGVLFSPLVEEFGWGRGAYSVATSIYVISMCLGSLPIGRLVDRWGPRRVMLGGALLGSLIWSLISRLGFLGRGTALGELYVLYGVLGAVGMASGSVSANTLVARWFRSRSGLALGLSAVGGGLPGVILVPLSAPLIADHGWRALTLGLAALSLASVPIVLWVLRDAPASGARPGVGGASAAPGMTARAALLSAPFWIVGVASLLAQFGSVAAQFHAIPFLMDRGLSRELASSIWGSLAFAGIVGKVGLGYAADHSSGRTVFFASIALHATAMAVALLIPGTAAAWLFALLLGLGMGGYMASRPVLVQEYFGLRAFGTITGAIYLFALPGMAGGQPLAGYLYDLTGSYTLAYSVFIGAFALGMAVLLFLGRARRADKPALE